MDPQLARLFAKRMQKIASMPPRRHLKFGLPYNVEDVTRQARMVYGIEGEEIQVVHCFATHKEYEKWYKTFR